MAFCSDFCSNFSLSSLGEEKKLASNISLSTVGYLSYAPFLGYFLNQLIYVWPVKGINHGNPGDGSFLCSLLDHRINIIIPAGAPFEYSQTRGDFFHGSQCREKCIRLIQSFCSNMHEGFPPWPVNIPDVGCSPLSEMCLSFLNVRCEVSV